MWKFYAILSALFAALTAIFAKAGLKNINPDLATAVRTVIILIISWGFVAMNGRVKDLESFTKSNWLFLVLSGIATGLSWLFYYRALQTGNTSIVSAIDKGSLLLVVLLSFLFLKEPVSPKMLIGVGVIFVGIVIVIWK